jgi:hypothetical protein
MRSYHVPEDLGYAFTYMCTLLMHAPFYESLPVKEEMFHSILNFLNVPFRNEKCCAVIHTKVDACSGKGFRVFFTSIGFF